MICDDTSGLLLLDKSLNIASFKVAYKIEKGFGC
jgi:hypothetical protein